VGERRAADQVADREGLAWAVLPVVVDLDLPVALHRDPRAAQPERLDVGSTATGDKQVVHLAAFPP
jgi:hypothetical protein